jgi:phosphate transport system substrate-binding protein
MGNRATEPGRLVQSNTPSMNFHVRMAALLGTISVLSPFVRADITARGSDSTIHVVKALAAAFEADTGKHMSLEGGGSGAGVKALVAGEVTLAFLSRDLTPDETASGLVGYSYAKDGVAVIVNKGNPVADLSLAALKDIFTGKTSEWPGGGPIAVFNRNAESGTREVFKDRVLGKDAFTDKAMIKHDGVLLETVAKIPSSVAFTSLGEAEGDTVKVLSVNGILPTPATLKDGTYPIARTPTLATKGAASGDEKAFIDFVLSPKGQAVAAKEGLVALH